MRARLGSLASLVAALLSGCLVIAPLDEPDPGGTGGTTLGGGSGGRGGNGGTAGDAGAGGEPLSPGGASAAGGSAARGGSAGKGGGGGVSGAAGGGEEPTGGTGDGGRSGDHECDTNEECVILGDDEPYLCRDHQCEPLKTNDCPLVYGDYSHPNPIYFGSFGLLNDANPDRNVTVWSSLLALEDINAAGGLPVGEDGESRPLVMVVCNSNEDQHPGVIKRGMSHLADDVRVQSVLATLRPRDLQQAFEDHIAKKLFFLSPISLTSTMTDSQYPNGDLVWNLLGQPSDFAPAYAKLLEHLETYLRKARSIDDDTPIKVAVVTTNDEFDADLYQFVYPRLRFNGLSSAKNAMDSNLAVVALDAADPDIQAARKQIIAFNPDIIVSTAGDVMTQGGLIAQVRMFWASTPRPEGERPYYILSPYNAGDLASLMTFIDSLAAPEEFMGISAASAVDSTLQNAYAARLRKEHGNMVNVDTGNYFDAVYTLAYAMVAAHDSLTGPNIAAAMPRLIEGEPFGARPEEIEGTLAWLAEPDQTIALSGTLGPPDYDPETGVRAATPAVFCFDRPGVLTLEDQVLRYDPETDEFTGTYPCIPNFAP